MKSLKVLRRPRAPSRWKRTAGAEMLEMAFVLPTLLASLLGMFWLGRGFNVYQTITRAAREGARYAVLPSCATCGNATVDTYSAIGTCISNPTNIFTNYVSPAMQASNLDPAQIPTSGVGSYCQKAQWLDASGDASTNANMPQQCGVVISFAYPLAVTLPFTSVNGTTINIKTQVQMRMENQSNNTSGVPTCP